MTNNGYVAGAILLCIVLLLAAVYLPGLSDVLNTQDPGRSGWALLPGMSLAPFVIGQLIRAFQSKYAGTAEEGESES
ncbi:cation transporting ATPase C-terminal domain-containing protein [Fodinibius sp.]|uniref:cation transporting ATPase C-terminal domain-containing protein n=1 Tax=Fodinibius sp. TaxID=1872440 RepID=UPI003A100EFB